MPKRSNNRRPRKNGNRAQATPVLAQLSQVWDQRLALQKDACHLNGRVNVLSISGATTINGTEVSMSILQTNGSAISEGNLGNRPYDVGTCFLRYRINRLLACYRPTCGTNTAGRIVIGFVDDPFPAAAQQPGNALAATDLRCNHSDSVYRDIEVEWTPVDKKRWYYVDVGTTGASADQRLAIPCNLVYAGTSLPTTTQEYGAITIYYDISFEGASGTSPASG